MTGPWPVVALQDVASNERRSITDGPFGSNLTSAHYTDSGPRVVRLQNIGDGKFVDAEAHISPDHFETLRAHEVAAGDLLVASLGEVLPRACLAPASLGPAIVKADCIRVRLNDNVNPLWVLRALQRPAARRWADSQRHGVGRPRLGLKTIRQTPIPLPDRATQDRVVEIIEEHFSHLDAADASLTLASRRLDRLRDQMIRRAVTGAGHAGPHDVLDIPVADAADGNLPALPRGWNWKRLGMVCDVVGGVTKDAKKQADPDYVEVPYLRVANVQRMSLRLDQVTRIRVAPTKADALRLRRGDILLNEGGDRDKLARGWVWEEQVEDCIHQNHVFRARPVPEVNPYFTAYATNTLGGPWAERNGKQSVNLASISLKMIRQMPIPVPPREQADQIARQLAEQLQQIARLEREVAHGRARQTALRRAVLSTAFSGRLTGASSDTDVIEEMANAVYR